MQAKKKKNSGSLKQWKYLMAWMVLFPQNSESIASLSSSILIDNRIPKPFSFLLLCMWPVFPLWKLLESLSLVLKNFTMSDFCVSVSSATAQSIWAFSIHRLLSFGSGEFSSIISLIIYSSLFSLFAEILYLVFGLAGFILYISFSLFYSSLLSGRLINFLFQPS